jgi:hypothetical protein
MNDTGWASFVATLSRAGAPKLSRREWFSQRRARIAMDTRSSRVIANELGVTAGYVRGIRMVERRA